MFSCHLLFTTPFNCLLVAYLLLDSEHNLIPTWCRPNVNGEVSAGAAERTLVESERLNEIADFPLT